MSSKFSLQRPYVVATLPKPIDRETGRYVVGEVYGGAPGQKKRKRSELAVGIDGEGVNIYDIPSSRLITSYALPPQSSFTCAPTSLRTRISKTHTSRRTYVSTTSTQSQVTLFKDDVEGNSGSKSTSHSRVFAGPKNPIIFTSTTAATFDPNAALGSADILVVKKDGEICCLDGETLEDKWISPASTLYRAQNGGKEESAEVEYAVLSSAFTVAQGIFKGNQDMFSIFPQEVSEDGFNPDVLVLISKSLSKGIPSSRWLHIITFPRRSSTQTSGPQQSVQPLLSAKFPADSYYRFENASTFGISVSSGTLQQLQDNILTTFALTELGPRTQSTLSIGSARSFLRLSNTSVLVSSEAKLSVYNPKYQSILSSIELENLTEKDSLKRKRGEDGAEKKASLNVCNLATYFTKLSAAVAVVGNDLVAIQIEGNQDRKGKSRTTGLLIDSLGCAAPEQMRLNERISKLKNLDSETLSTYLPSSLNSSGPLADRIQKLEAAFSAGDVPKFDELMMKKLKPSTVEVNGAQPDKPHQRDPLAVDRRMIMYALSKIFELNKCSNERKTTILFYAPKTFLWLIKNGHMTVSNIQTALNQQEIPASELVLAICEINPDMDLLLALIGNNYVEATGLVCAIRALMDSLGLLGEASRSKQRLLTNGEESEDASGIDEQLEKLEAEAENDLSLAEYQLESGSSVRGQALSLALSKLYACPTTAIIHAFQTVFSGQEVVCLIYLLRFELARGGWTDKYLDTDPEANEEEPGVTDNAIILIASLLGNCIDAVGAGGWLSGDAKLIRGDGSEAEDLISSLKFEISAALEAIEEGTYLKGITSEMVRYGNAVQNALSENSEAQRKIPAKKKQKKSKPMAVQIADPEQALLPLGLKAEQHISKFKVGAGGEVQSRTKRDIGNLLSQRVGKYTLERISI